MGIGLLLLLAAGARAESPCVAIKDLGCWYAPASLRGENAPGLLVYHRGHWGEHAGRVPAARRVASSRQAFQKFALGKAAEGARVAVLVTGSSDASIGPGTVQGLEAALQLRFARVILASHSGGYVGLEGTLDRLGRLDRLVLLDTFYFGPDLAAKLGRPTLPAKRDGREVPGVGCSGFYTEHNRARYERTFKPVARCAVEARDDFGHDGAVDRCLPAYLAGAPCAP